MHAGDVVDRVLKGGVIAIFRLSTVEGVVPGEGIEPPSVPWPGNSGHAHTDRSEVTDAVVWVKQCKELGGQENVGQDWQHFPAELREFQGRRRGQLAPDARFCCEFRKAFAKASAARALSSLVTFAWIVVVLMLAWPSCSWTTSRPSPLARYRRVA